MISYVKGKLAYKDPAYVVIDVNGIGYSIGISLNTFSAIGNNENIKLHTYFHVKEDIQALYGFYEESEREVFKALISISGIGPKSALIVLSTLDPEELKQAILMEDAKTIQSVKGIGAKTAQRVVLELKDKVGKMDAQGTLNISPNTYNTTKEEALSALTTLGIAKSSAEKAIDKFLKQSGGDTSVEEIIKAVLKSA